MRGIEHMPWLYDSVAGVMDALGLMRWRRHLVQGATGRTLEIGCGTGRNLPLYAQDVEVIALDPDRAALIQAHRRAPHVPLVVGRTEALPFVTGSFDTVVSSLVFCSVQDPMRGLQEIRRILRPAANCACSRHAAPGDASGQACRIRSSRRGPV